MPVRSPRKAVATPSAKAKGKQKAIEADASAAGSPSKGHEEEDEVRSPPTKRPKVALNATRSSARARRVAAAAEEGGSSSSEDDDDDDGDQAGGKDGDGDFAAFQAVAANGEGFVRATPADAYFLAQSRPGKTSANRLSSRPGGAAWETFTPTGYLEALKAWESSRGGQERARVRDALVESYSKRWGQWYFELVEGFSLLFHGLGSKREMVNRFAEKVCRKDGDVVIVNGFQAGLGISDVLDAVEEVFSPPQEASNPTPKIRSNPSLDALEARARKLCDPYSSSTTFMPRQTRSRRPLYLMLHNLDGPGLRTTRAQTVLSLLAAQPGIRVLATVDHIHAPMLFPSSIATSRPSSSSIPVDKSGYNFLYHHTPTFAPYILEPLLDGTLSRLFPPPLFPPTISGASNNAAGGNLRGATNAKAMFHVLASVTRNAKDLYKLLATRQIDGHSSLDSSELLALPSQLQGAEECGTPPVAVPWRVLWLQARDGFIATSEQRMEALLMEFRDHGIVLGSMDPPSTRGPAVLGESGEDESGGDGEWLWISATKDMLEEVLVNFGD